MIKLGLKRMAATDPITDREINITVISGMDSPNREDILLANKATGMVIPSSDLIGIMNNAIPMTEGIKNFKKSIVE